MTDSVLLYAAGALEPAEADEVRRHLAIGCPRCAGLLAEAEATVALLALTLPEQSPAPAIKSNLLSRTGGGIQHTPVRLVPASPTTPAQTAEQMYIPWYAILFVPSAIAAIVAAGLAIFFAMRLQPPPAAPQSNNEAVVGMLTSEVQKDQQELAALRSGQTTQTVAWAASPNMKFLWLDGTEQQPGAGGRIFWDTKSGVWHFFAQNVKAPPAGKTYELWFVSGDGKTALPAGEFNPTPNGDAAMVTPVPPAIAPNLAVGAVTDEPAGQTITAPSGKFQFKGTVQ